MNEAKKPDRAPDRVPGQTSDGPSTSRQAAGQTGMQPPEQVDAPASLGAVSGHSERSGQSDRSDQRPLADVEAFESLPASLNPLWQKTALVSLVALFLWCIAWEIWLAPLKPGGTFMFLKALPLAFAIRGVAKGSLYTLQWSSMLILLYFMEGVVRVASDPPGPSILMAWIEIVLSSVFFVAALAYLRPAKKAYKQKHKSKKHKAETQGG